MALRPTSETAMYPMFALWVRSHTDLPMKFYQVVNTFRYETKHTRPLIRVREITTFKEAHTVHSTKEGAENQVKDAINIYKEFFINVNSIFNLIFRSLFGTVNCVCFFESCNLPNPNKRPCMLCLITECIYHLIKLHWEICVRPDPQCKHRVHGRFTGWP